MKSIRCHACGHENELQRVYCHNCGEKLDRSKVHQPKESKLRQDAMRQVQKTLKPPYPYFRLVVLPFLRTLLLAAITASLINIFTPGKVPDPPSDQARMNPPQLPLLVEQIMTDPSGGRLAFTDEQVTAWLGTQLRSNAASGLGYTVELDRAAMEFLPGVVRLYLIRQVTAGVGDTKSRESENKLTFPFVIAGDYRLSVKNQKLSAECLGIRVGRLWIPALIAKPTQSYLFAEMGKLFDREKKTLERLQNIEVEKNRVVLSSSPTE